MKPEHHGARIERLENVVYSMNGEPGLIEQIRTIQSTVDRHTRLLWVAVALSAASLLDQVLPLAQVVGRLLGL